MVMSGRGRGAGKAQVEAVDASTERGMAERERAIDVAISQIERQFGKGSIMKMGDATSRLAIDVIPTGAIELDMALGVGGIPRGRITEIYGPESSGKTTICQHIIAEAQRTGGVAAFVDAEHALDPLYAQRCGVNLDDLLVSQPDTGEQALEIVETLVRSGAIDVVVVDSVAALVPRAEIDGDMGDSHVGLQARLMSQALRKLTGAINRSKTSVIFTNQLRMKIGVMFGNPETTSGGRALKFYASVRMEVRRIEAIKGGTDVIGSRTRVKVVKNKVAPPFKQAEFDIMYNEGISKSGSILDAGVNLGLVRKSGAFFYLDEERLGQGERNAKDFLKNNPEIMADLEGRIRATAPSNGFQEPLAAVAAVDDDEELGDEE
jgi:recombination protein RecA